MPCKNKAFNLLIENKKQSQTIKIETMKTYIRNLKGLLYTTGRHIEPEEIGYGEEAVVFTHSQCNDFSDFLENGELGTSFLHENEWLCKVKNDEGDAIIVYEDDNGEVNEW